MAGKVLSDEELAAIRRRVEAFYKAGVVQDVYRQKLEAIDDIMALLEHIKSISQIGDFEGRKHQQNHDLATKQAVNETKA